MWDQKADNVYCSMTNVKATQTSHQAINSNLYHIPISDQG